MKVERKTIQSIVSQFNAYVKEGIEVAPHKWIDAALEINALIWEEHDKLYDLEQAVAIAKADIIEDGSSVASAEVQVQAMDIYKEFRKQKGRIKILEDWITTARARAKLKDTEMGSY